ncbi:MAG: EamA family transporter [Polyangiaceae bacterium]|nr:EamA family transporter [Polyangiaceae bacterium]
MIRVHLALLTVQLLFGLWPVAGAMVLGVMPPAALIGFRLLLGAPLLVLATGVLFRPLPSGGDLLRLALLAALGISINQLLFAEGLHRAGPVNASLSILLVPAVSVLVARALRLERLDARRVFGVVIALIGAAILLEVERFDPSSRRMIGNLMLVVNASVYASYLVLARPVIARVGSVATVAWIFLFGMLEALPFTWTAVWAVSWLSLPSWTYGALAFVLFGATLTTYLLNAYALGRIESSVVATYVYLQPVVASVAAYFLLDDLPTGRSLVAGATIVVGVVIVAARRGGSFLSWPRGHVASSGTHDGGAPRRETTGDPPVPGRHGA